MAVVSVIGTVHFVCRKKIQDGTEGRWIDNVKLASHGCKDDVLYERL